MILIHLKCTFLCLYQQYFGEVHQYLNSTKDRNHFDTNCVYVVLDPLCILTSWIVDLSKEEKIEEAKLLWKMNDEKDPKDRLSMRAIAKKLNLPKTTVIERLSGKCQGEGYIAGGKRKARVLMDGKQTGQQEGQNNHNHNCFNQTFKWVTK